MMYSRIKKLQLDYSLLLLLLLSFTLVSNFFCIDHTNHSQAGVEVIYCFVQLHIATLVLLHNSTATALRGQYSFAIGFQTPMLSTLQTIRDIKVWII